LGSVWTSLLLLIAGAFIVEAVRYAVEYVKRITPRIEYRVWSGIPVKTDDKQLCAYRLKISNPSRKRVENVTFHVRSSNTNLKLEMLSKPDGFEFNLADKDGGVDFSFPYLKQGGEVVVRAQAESKYWVPESLGISVSSPNDIEDKRITDADVATKSKLRIPIAFIYGSAFGVFIVGIVASIMVNHANRQGWMTPTYEMDRRDVVISAASVVGLPHIEELYLTAYDPKYFNEGDIAYSLAVASNNPDEIGKYRRLLSLTLGTAPEMASESQANLFYSLGKLDLLLSDEKSALADFQNAVAKSRPIVEAQAKADTKIHKYLIERGLL
jgi:hypothetical protein